MALKYEEKPSDNNLNMMKIYEDWKNASPEIREKRIKAFEERLREEGWTEDMLKDY